MPIPPLPPPLTPLFDTHCHLDQPEFDEDRDAVLQRARATGLVGMLCVGITAASSRAAVELARLSDLVYAAVGIQPNYGAQAVEGDWETIVDLARHSRVVAIGETGLDRYWDFTPFEMQRAIFARHLELSRETGLPVLIHSRDCDADLLPMLRDEARRGPLRGLMHAFSSDSRVAAECLELGLDLSFCGNVTYKNAKFEPIREAARLVPADRILVETDSPYIVPQALRGKHPRNEPALVAHTARVLASLRGETPEALALQTTVNARRLFGLPARV